MRSLLAAMLVLAPLAAAGAELPIFDAHLHYSHDAWEAPELIVTELRPYRARGGVGT